MNRPPISPKAGIFSHGLGWQIVWVGILVGFVSLAVGYWGFLTGRDLVTWRTMVFTALTMAQMGNAIATRTTYDSVFKIGIFSNRLMVVAVLLACLLQLLLLYIPFLQNIFETAPLTGIELGISTVVGVIVFAAIEVEKRFKHLYTTQPVG